MQTRYIAYNYSYEVADAVTAFADLDETYAANAMLTAVMYNPLAGPEILNSVLEVNTVNNLTTTAFDQFNKIPFTPANTPDSPAAGKAESMSLLKASDRTVVPEGTLNTGSYLTFANDVRLVKYAMQQHADLVAELKPLLGAEGFSTIMDFQPLNAYLSNISIANGGNMLGLERSPRNKLFWVIGVTMSSPEAQAQYPLVTQEASALAQRVEKLAESLGLNEQFRYLNYARAWQDSLGSYGAENVMFMKKVASKYDCHGFFQKRVPGGSKLDRVG